MNQERDQTEKAEGEGAATVPEAGVGRLHRLKQFFVTDYVRTIDRLSRVLKRLKGLIGKPKEKDSSEEEKDQKEERSESRSAPKKTKGTTAGDAAAAAPPPAPHSAVRTLLVCLLGLVIGVIAGMIFSFALLSNMVINQAQKIGDQRDEISQLEKLYSRVLESEAKYRNKLTETESKLNQLTRTIEKDAESAEPVTAPGATTGKAGAARKVADCSLDSGSPDKLAKCVEEFNRQTGR